DRAGAQDGHDHGAPMAPTDTGTQTAAVCVRCGGALTAGARFCPTCGLAVGQQGAMGERKQVTALFADIAASTTLVDGIDPEQAADLLDPAVDAMIAAVHRFGGTVAHVAGDGVMALFGAPVAVEDHAVRACYAALEIPSAVARAADPRVRVRVGLNSGDVLVKAISTDMSMEYTAIGATIHLAAKLEKHATPGTVLAT